jgi:phenylalanyl-tRNA synthetase beta chain
MKISVQWLREFVDLKVETRKLAEDLTRAGIAVESVTGDGDAAIFSMEITTNRVDAMNHYGVARECAAIYVAELKPIVSRLPQPAGTTDFKIEIEAPELCARYTARVLKNTRVTASPAHIAKRLESMDARPINSAADATNYNLIEMGHPTHAFDLDTLQGGKIVVRRARAGEMLKTLDGADRKLTSDDLVIADGERAVALAGVMGGFDTMITEKTRNVLIESAWFDPMTVRKTARRHGMHSDASHRFERGADFAATPLACARVAQLILEAGGGEMLGEEIDAIGRQIERPEVALRYVEVERILGVELPREEIARMLARLGFGVRGSGDKGWHVVLPTWRLDVEREIDLIEEIARLWGYDRFPNTLPAFTGAVVELPDAPKETATRSCLRGLGYHAAISTTFISEADAKAFSTEAPLELANPISEEATVLRTSLVPGMLDMLAWNLNRGVSDARLFEMGKVFAALGSDCDERKALVIGATGNAGEPGVHHAPRPYSFYDLKGDIETLLGQFAHQSLYFDALTTSYYHPGRAARAVMDGATVARFGQIHPEAAERRKLRQEVYVAEIALDRLFKSGLREPAYQPVPRFPAVERDFSFVFGQDVSFERIRAAVAGLKLAELRAFRPVETFRGGAIPAGKYSLLLRATFQSGERTLRDDEVAAWAGRIVKALKTLGGTLRA